MTMDDPNFIPNSPGIDADQTETASMSPSKRTIVLGVVNTSGMKSVNLNRKRRWDQPPDESGEAPSAKMVHLNESIESPESSCDPTLDRISEEPADPSGQCDIVNSNEPDEPQWPVSSCEKVISDDSLMMVDEPPNDVCDRLAWPDKSSSDVTSSEQNECKNILNVGPSDKCSDSVSDEKVNSLSELRIGVTDKSLETDTSMSPASENPVVVNTDNKIRSSTIVSHQSEELRRIMFSYNEGMSDSDTSDSNVLSPISENNKTEKAKNELLNSESISEVKPLRDIDPNVNPSKEPVLVNENSLVLNEIEFPLQSDLLNKEGDIPEQPVNKDPKSLQNDVSSIETTDSVISEKIESHFNIPNKNEPELTAATKGLNCVDNSPVDLVNEKEVNSILKSPEKMALEYFEGNNLLPSKELSPSEKVESTPEMDKPTDIIKRNESSDNVSDPKVNEIHEDVCDIRLDCTKLEDDKKRIDESQSCSLSDAIGSNSEQKTKNHDSLEENVSSTDNSSELLDSLEGNIDDADNPSKYLDSLEGKIGDTDNSSKHLDSLEESIGDTDNSSKNLDSLEIIGDTDNSSKHLDSLENIGDIDNSTKYLDSLEENFGKADNSPKHLGNLEENVGNNDDPTVSVLANDEINSSINPANDPKLESELMDTNEGESTEIKRFNEVSFDESKPMTENPSISIDCNEVESKHTGDKTGELHEDNRQMDSTTESTEVKSHILQENSLQMNSACFDDVNSNKLKSEAEKQLANNVDSDYKTDIISEEFGDSGKGNDIISELHTSASKSDNIAAKSSSFDQPVSSPNNIKVASEMEQNVDTSNLSSSKCNQIEVYNNTSELNPEEIEGNKIISEGDGKNSIPEPTELPSTCLNESDKSDLPSDRIDPDVIKVILGSVDESSRGIGSLKDEDCSAGPSTPDSNSNASKGFTTVATPPTEPVDEVVTKETAMDFNDIDSSAVLEQTGFPEPPDRVSETNVFSEIPDSLQGLDEIEPCVVVPEETIFEEIGDNSVLNEGSPVVSLPFDATDADASLESTSIITVARDLQKEDSNIDTPDDTLSVKDIEGASTVTQDEEEIESITTEVLEEEIGPISSDKGSPEMEINELSEPEVLESGGRTVITAELTTIEAEEELCDVTPDNTLPSSLKETPSPQVNNIDVGDVPTCVSSAETGNEVTTCEETAVDSIPESSLTDKNKLSPTKESVVTEEETNLKFIKPTSEEESNFEFVKPVTDKESNLEFIKPSEASVDDDCKMVNAVSNDIDDSNKALTEEIETFDVIEEIVTCEPSASDRTAAAEVEDIVNEDENARFAPEETQESVESTDDLLAVMDNDTSDAQVSDNDNQNNVIIETSVFMKTDENLSSKAVDNTTTKTIKSVEVELNSISEMSLPEKMDVDETPLNPINEAEVSVDEPMEVEDSLVQVKKADKISCDSTFSGVINSVVNESELSKDKPSSDIPLLKAVSSHDNTDSGKEKIVQVDSQPLKGSDACRLEPLTLKIYKDNLTVKTDELDSPKKHKSPKFPSDSKSQHSPRSKTMESASSLSPQNKEFEYTLKIAKDANTNIPKATMSPKNMSPSSSWKLERGSLSPNSPGEPGVSLKLKLSKPSPSGLSSDSCPSLSSALNNKPASAGSEEHSNNRLEKKDDGIATLPQQTLQIGSALKLIMEVEKTEGKAEGSTSSILEQVLSGSSNDGSGVKKRGRPRKPIDCEVLPVNNSPPPGGGEVDMMSDTHGLDTSGDDPNSNRHVRSCRARTQPIITKPRKPRGGGAAGGSTRGGGRGGARGVARPIASAEEAEKIQEKLSEKEKAELAKIEARKEKMRLDRIAKNEAKKAKKLAKKLKDEERRKRQAAEKAEKAAAAAPQVFEEETRMSASESRGHTPAPSSRLLPHPEGMEESQSSITLNTPKTGNHKGRMEIPIDPESDEVRVDQLAEYQWQGSELCMIQEQVSNYLGVKSFKRKYPDLRRRLVEAEERTFLEDSGLVPKSMCDLGLTAVSSAEILDIMYQDFPDKYEEFRQYVRDKQAREMSFKQKALASQTQSAKAKGELRELALEAAAMWNSNLNRERREERRCALDLQTLTVNYPKLERDRMVRNPLRPGVYPVAVIPGQFSDYYKTYTPTELMYFPLNTVMYGPLKPNERRDGSDSSSSSSDDSSGTSSSDESEDEGSTSKECKICNGEKKTTTETVPEILLQCSQCKGLCHPTCQEITPEMLPHIKKYSWHCSNCKQCVRCKSTSKEEKMLFCDLCDRGYHLTCVGLKKSPEGRWHCSVCSYCTVCGSKDPGGPEWFYEYKKTDKGVRLYQRTLCAPCSKNALM